MTLTDEVYQLRQQGTSDEVISQLLTRRGYRAQEVTEALATSAIRDAVNAPAQNEQDLQPSLSATGYSQDTTPMAIPQPEPQPQQQYADQAYQDQSQQYAYTSGGGSGGVSGDTITEIAEQVVTEKMSRVENTLNQLSIFKGTSESQLRSLDERLKRIENIIDKLQLSLLQRVGDYLTNVEDVKRELIETQKTVKSMGARGQQTQTQSTQQTNRTRQTQVQSE